MDILSNIIMNIVHNIDITLLLNDMIISFGILKGLPFKNTVKVQKRSVCTLTRVPLPICQLILLYHR